MATETAVARTSSSLTPLCKLAEKHGTDKFGFYTPIYDLLLSGRRDRVFKVLEVGIGTPEAMKHVPGYKAGASLRMWRDYFPHAEIYGLDINANAAASVLGDRIVGFQCNQASEEELDKILPHLALGGSFDLIVDDGSHNPQDQLLTFQYLSRLLAPRGLYIIEDVDINFPHNELPEHTELWHSIPGGIGKAILIRKEAIDG